MTTLAIFEQLQADSKSAGMAGRAGSWPLNRGRGALSGGFAFFSWWLQFYCLGFFAFLKVKLLAEDLRTAQFYWDQKARTQTNPFSALRVQGAWKPSWVAQPEPFLEADSLLELVDDCFGTHPLSTGQGESPEKVSSHGNGPS